MRTPEIHAGEPFGQALTELIKSRDIHAAVETGAWDGLGSTKCIVDAFNTDKPSRLISYEVVPERHAELVQNVAELLNGGYSNIGLRYKVESPLIKVDALLGSPALWDHPTVQSCDFETMWGVANKEAEMARSLGKPYALTTYHRDVVETWFNRDVRVMENSNIFNLWCEVYDLAEPTLLLIDGSEFTGATELADFNLDLPAEGSYQGRMQLKWVALDDVNSYKNFFNYHRLKTTTSAKLIAEGNHRNGWAIFEI